ncbi:MAG: hypothetical protein JJU02_08245 [Cryomorphaceae bacterium]|nr:hypothetical protein [Cryomorphaceae bacterium]
MRVVDTIAHPNMRIIIYTLEKHFYVEFEAGPMKQGFRFSKESAGGLEGIKKMMDSSFISEVETRFHAMYLQAKNATAKMS